jgi:CBS domain containing-hemolysin-like protein
MSPAATGLELLLVLAMVLANALFVAAELALVSSRRTRMDQLAAEGSRRASLVRSAMEHPVTFFAGTQVGITVASLVLGWVGEPAVAGALEPLFAALPGLEAAVPPRVLTIAIAAVAFFIITFFHIVFGEIVPKSLAVYRAEPVAVFAVPPVLLFARVARPLIWLINAAAERVVGLFGLHPAAGRHAVHSAEEIRALVAESRQAGLVEPEEEELVRRVFRFGDRVAREVMVPRTRVAGIPAGANLTDVVATFRASGFSRMPVYERDLDNIVGVLTAKDALRALGSRAAPATAADIMRPAYYIPETKELAELLPEMRSQQTQLAVVLDEFGGTAGILTIEDLIEEVVGEIVSEYGSERRFVHRVTEQELVVDAEINLDDVNELWGLELPTTEADTVGGFVYQQLGHIPIVGESFSYDGLGFSVSSMRGRAIGTVRITRPGKAE